MKYLVFLLLTAFSLAPVLSISEAPQLGYLVFYTELYRKYPRIMELPETNPVRLNLEASQFMLKKYPDEVVKQHAYHLLLRVHKGIHYLKALSRDKEASRFYSSTLRILCEEYPPITPFSNIHCL